jgi:hypothetical protein
VKFHLSRARRPCHEMSTPLDNLRTLVLRI